MTLKRKKPLVSRTPIRRARSRWRHPKLRKAEQEILERGEPKEIVKKLKAVIRRIESRNKLVKKTASKGSLKDLRKELDTIFSRYIRLRVTDEDGMLHCFICGTPIYWRAAQCMHYMPRICKSVRWDEVNCQAGCPTCNGKPLGDRENFAAALDLKYGPGTAEALEIKSKRTAKAASLWMSDKIHYYREKVRAYGRE